MMNNLKSAYVFVSRAKSSIKLYSNNKSKLIDLFKFSTEKENAFEINDAKFKSGKIDDTEISTTAKYELVKILNSKKKSKSKSKKRSSESKQFKQISSLSTTMKQLSKQKRILNFHLEN